MNGRHISNLAFRQRSLVVGLDYFPTTLDILGFKMKGQPDPIDGISLVPLFEGKMKDRPVPIPFETLAEPAAKHPGVQQEWH